MFLWMALFVLTLTELYLCFAFVALNESRGRATLTFRIVLNGIFALVFISNTAMWLHAWRSLRMRERTK